MTDPRTHRRRAERLARQLYGDAAVVTTWRERYQRLHQGHLCVDVACYADVLGVDSPTGEGLTIAEAVRDLAWRLEHLARGEPEPVGHVGDFEVRV